MSREKLNKRQLKKISKFAMNVLIKRGDVKQDCVGFCEETGEYWHGWKLYDDWDEMTCFESLAISFDNLFCYRNEIDLIENWNKNRFPKKYYSKSFANKVHYIIKYMEIMK